MISNEGISWVIIIYYSTHELKTRKEIRFLFSINPLKFSAKCSIRDYFYLEPTFYAH